jgi:hypothetical protein
MNALRTARAAFRPLLLLGLALPAGAIQSGFPPRGTTPKVKPVPTTTVYPSLRYALTSLPVPDLQELDFGTFFGNEERTLIVLASGRLVEIHDPSVFSIQSLEISLTGVTSAAALPAAASGGAAGLFASNAAVLEQIPGSTTWVFGPPTTLRGQAWAGMRRLQALREDGTSRLWGISADGKSVPSLVDLGSGWATGPTVSLTEMILDTAVLDFDGDGDLDVALLARSGVHVLQQNGATLATFPAEGATEGEIERLPGSPELLAWATLDDVGDPVLLVLGYAGVEPTLPLEFPIVAGQAPEPLAVAAMTAGDLNGDGQHELVLTDQGSHRAVLLWNRAQTGQHFAGSAAGTDYQLLQLLSPVSTPGTGNDCAPLVADLDGNGRADLAFGLDTTDEVVLFLDVPLPSLPAVAAIQTNGAASPATSYFNAGGCQPPDMSPTCTDGVLNLAFDLTQQVADSFDYVEVILWQQPLQGGALVPLSISHTLHAFYGTPPRSTHQWLDVTIPETWLVWPTGSHYWVRSRFCRADTSVTPPVILAATPSAVGGLTLRHNGAYGWPPLTLDDPDFDYLESQATGIGFLMTHLPFPDASAAALFSAPAHLGLLGGPRAPLLGNAYVGAFYTKVKIPQPMAGTGLETTPPVLVTGQHVPW